MTKPIRYALRGRAVALWLLVVCSALVPAWAATPPETASKASTVLDEMLNAPDRGMAADMLRNAYAVVVLPSVIKAGLVVGGRHGHGVLSVRHPDGWSAPVFVTIAGGSVGLQAGVSSTDVLLVFRSKAGVDSLVEGKFLMGTDIAVAAGPVGRNAQAATDPSLQAEVYAWSRARGLYVGFSLQGASLKINAAANRQVYGADVDVARLLDGASAAGSPATVQFQHRLTEYTSR